MEHVGKWFVKYGYPVASDEAPSLPENPLSHPITGMNTLTHFDAQGQPHMVDVPTKATTHRIAVAGGRIDMHAATLAIIESHFAHRRAGGDILRAAPRTRTRDFLGYAIGRSPCHSLE